MCSRREIQTLRNACKARTVSTSTGESEGTGEDVWELLYVAVVAAVILGLVTSIMVSIVFIAVVGVLFSFAWATK